MQHPILFIHGFGGSRKEFQPIISYLKRHGDVPCYEFCYNKKFGEVSLRVIAAELHNFIVAQVTEPVIDIVAVSQGGIIARYYLSHFDDVIVRKCITLCTPHQVTYLAYLGRRIGVRELRPGSDLLRELDTVKTQYFAIYNPLDLMVFPGSRARFSSAQENKMVVSPLHQLTFWNKRTLEYVVSTLGKT
jgi:pimeloyl-ACP methyl ester carboxylesterase